MFEIASEKFAALFPEWMGDRNCLIFITACILMLWGA